MASGSEMIKWRAYQNRSYLVLQSLPKYSVAAFNFRFRQWTGRARILPEYSPEYCPFFLPLATYIYWKIKLPNAFAYLVTLKLCNLTSGSDPWTREPIRKCRMYCCERSSPSRHADREPPGPLCGAKQM